jgi:hypothetical protein
MEINESDRTFNPFSDEPPRTLQEVYNDLLNQFQSDAPSELSPMTVSFQGSYFTIPGDGNIHEVVGIENED